MLVGFSFSPDLHLVKSKRMTKFENNKKTNKMTLELYTELRHEIEVRLDKADDLLKSFPVGPMGLVKMTDEFRVAKRKFDLVFNELRVLNKNTSNKIKREYAMNKRFKK